MQFPFSVDPSNDDTSAVFLSPSVHAPTINISAPCRIAEAAKTITVEWASFTAFLTPMSASSGTQAPQTSRKPCKPWLCMTQITRASERTGSLSVEPAQPDDRAAQQVADFLAATESLRRFKLASPISAKPREVRQTQRSVDMWPTALACNEHICAFETFHHEHYAASSAVFLDSLPMPSSMVFRSDSKH